MDETGVLKETADPVRMGERTDGFVQVLIGLPVMRQQIA